MNNINRKALFVVPPKVHLLDINGPAHIFYEAKEYGANLELHFISPINESNTSSSAGLKFHDLELFETFQLGKEDFVVIPGLYFSLLSDKAFLKKCKPFFDWLRQCDKVGVNICSVCTGSFLLAEAGILNNRCCTTHWKRIKSLKERYPDIDVKENRLLVIDNNIYTSAGISSGIDLAIFLLEEKFSPKLAADVAKEAVVYFRRGEYDPQLSIYLQYRNHLEERIHNAQEFIIKNLNKPFNQTEIAENVNMSVRNLTRLFKKATGITIHHYTEKLRVERAINLLEENNKMEMVAEECGFKSVSQLNLVLKKYTK
ncbi:DJ-1/PfpI family protein [Aquimarina gracilis]|uniref:DJ-1/PfpI family protein n=1 Tax=Aquimarina gracilis TaxID=874422 RepID=A0ABU5ZZ34_9FLAO|nr:DJ-1/PfpI family protein [Aquimarina gracilis]MEB3347092.1 DJ-1/PfpI family protein [Aquimarina gracilis]